MSLKALTDAIRDSSVEVIDLTAPLTSDTPIINLPEPFGNTARFTLTAISHYDERGPAWYWNDIVTGNMWTTRHGKLLGPQATLVQVDDDASAIGAQRPVHLGGPRPGPPVAGRPAAAAAADRREGHVRARFLVAGGGLPRALAGGASQAGPLARGVSQAGPLGIGASLAGHGTSRAR